MPKSNLPKGRRHRCSSDFEVGGRPLGPGEVAWILRDGVVVKLRSRKQLDGTSEQAVVTKGHVPKPQDFTGNPARGWAGEVSATTVKPPTSELARDVKARPRLTVADNENAPIVHDIAETVHRAGGRALIVGGAVRDAIFNERAQNAVAPKDVDMEVYGLDPTQLQALLERQHQVDLAGSSFAVLKIGGYDIDVSLPRRESKVGSGHRGFAVQSDPHMSPQEAARRRDFTINAIAYDPLTGEVIDPFGGQDDLRRGILRHVGPQFGEDPLRVLRGAQFIARFDLTADATTTALCRTLHPELATLPPERIWGETTKLLLKGIAPGAGVRFLRDCDWLDAWPGVDAIAGVAQDPRWHPEGDVLTHTAWALDAWRQLRPEDADEHDELVTGLAVLTHDLGKAHTTDVDATGRVRAHGHEQAGVEPARALVQTLSHQRALADEVAVLVAHHLAPVSLHQAQAGDAAIRRLANKVGRIDRLIRVAAADQAGRPAPGQPLVVGAFPAGEWLAERATALDVARTTVAPLASGKDVLAAGGAPGPAVGALLRELAHAQEDGSVTTRQDALAFIDQRLHNSEAAPR